MFYVYADDIELINDTGFVTPDTQLVHFPDFGSVNMLHCTPIFNEQIDAVN